MRSYFCSLKSTRLSRATMLSERDSIKLGITKNQWPLPDIPHELTLDMQATIVVHLGPASGEPGIVKVK